MGALPSIHGTRAPRRLFSLFRFVAAVLTVAAVLVAILAALTFLIANEVMRREPMPVANFPANIMPPYSIVGFSSLDGQDLSGWFFPSKGVPRGTIVMIHDDAGNRLQFGEATASLYKDLVARRFNVLSFDLRHSGDSEGRLTTYGYREWEDVLAAVDYARKTTTTFGVVLFGFGSGAGAALAAWNELPATEADRKDVARSVASLPFTRDYLLAMVLDEPERSPDDSIRKAMERMDVPSFFPLPITVPLAVHLSAGANREYPLSALASRYPRPMLVFESRRAEEPRSTLLAERIRLHPEATSAFERTAPTDGQLFLTDEAGYLEALSDFLDRYFLK